MSQNILRTFLEDKPNSFDENLLNFDHSGIIYSHPIFANSKYEYILKYCPALCCIEGFYLQNDLIVPNTEDSYCLNNDTIKLRLWNYHRYYYTYKEERYGFRYLFYTKKGFEIVRQFAYNSFGEGGKELFDDNVIGCVTIFGLDSWGEQNQKECSLTILLTKKILPHKRCDNISLLSKEIAISSLLENDLTKTFALSLINKIVSTNQYLSYIGQEELDLNLIGGIHDFIEENSNKMTTNNLMKSPKMIACQKYRSILGNIRTDEKIANDFVSYLKGNYELFDNDIKDVVAYLFPKEYKYTPMGQTLTNEFLKTNIVAFINCINQDYYCGVLDESLPFSCDDILVDAINKMVEKIIKGILNNKQSYPILESNNILSFETSTALLYILA